MTQAARSLRPARLKTSLLPLTLLSRALLGWIVYLDPDQIHIIRLLTLKMFICRAFRHRKVVSTLSYLRPRGHSQNESGQERDIDSILSAPVLVGSKKKENPKGTKTHTKIRMSEVYHSTRGY